MSLHWNLVSPLHRNQMTIEAKTALNN